MASWSHHGLHSSYYALNLALYFVPSSWWTVLLLTTEIGAVMTDTEHVQHAGFHSRRSAALWSTLTFMSWLVCPYFVFFWHDRLAFVKNMPFQRNKCFFILLGELRHTRDTDTLEHLHYVYVGLLNNNSNKEYRLWMPVALFAYNIHNQ